MAKIQVQYTPNGASSPINITKTENDNTYSEFESPFTVSCQNKLMPSDLIITATDTNTNPAVNVQSSKSVTLTGGTTTIAPDTGYDALAQVSATVTTATQATPSVSINPSTGKVTATATQSAGYVTAGTKQGTLQLTTQAAKTVTPSSSSQTAVAASRYTTGAVTVAAVPTESKTITENGTHTASSGKWWESVTVNVPSSTPSLQSKSSIPNSLPITYTPDYGYGYDGLSSVTVNKPTALVPSNIKNGVNLFGVLGTYSGDSSGSGGATSRRQGVINDDGKVQGPFSIQHMQNNPWIARAILGADNRSRDYDEMVMSFTGSITVSGTAYTNVPIKIRYLIMMQATIGVDTSGSGMYSQVAYYRDSTYNDIANVQDYIIDFGDTAQSIMIGFNGETMSAATKTQLETFMTPVSGYPYGGIAPTTVEVVLPPSTVTLDYINYDYPEAFSIFALDSTNSYTGSYYTTVWGYLAPNSPSSSFYSALGSGLSRGSTTWTFRAVGGAEDYIGITTSEGHVYYTTASGSSVLAYQSSMGGGEVGWKNGLNKIVISGSAPSGAGATTDALYNFIRSNFTNACLTPDFSITVNKGGYIFTNIFVSRYDVGDTNCSFVNSQALDIMTNGAATYFNIRGGFQVLPSAADSFHISTYNI